MKTYSSLSQAIKDIYGDNRFIKKRISVSGGDINEAYRLTLDDGTDLFMKSNSPACITNFEREAMGLDLIRASRAIGVPKVLAVGRDSGFSFLLLEQIKEGKKIKGFWETFARELADMHRADLHWADLAEGSGLMYGLPYDNWIGATKQINSPRESWITFFRDCRLKPQFTMAGNYFSPGDKKRIEALMGRLDHYLLEAERPSLVHGDLWAGNMITGNDGKGWLIDPAVYYGHAEVDIAMTELFGGYSYQFYGAYKEVGLMEAGYEDRRDLYNLYHLLNHLNIFGGGYYSSVMRIVNYYAG